VTTAVPRLGAEVLDDLDRRLAPADAELAGRYPGDAGTRQPVHTVYVPADQMTPDLPAAERRARHLLVGGEHVVRDGRLLGADMDALRRDLARRARRLWPEDAR
jgi:hypothetical protein